MKNKKIFLISLAFFSILISFLVGKDDSGFGFLGSKKANADVIIPSGEGCADSGGCGEGGSSEGGSAGACSGGSSGG